VTTKRPSKQSGAEATVLAPAKRRRSAVSRARRVRSLVTAPPEKCFWVHYGPVLKDLRELREALAGQISDAQFAHHAGPHGNDFANWVEQVLDEAACARALRRTRGVAGALRAVETALRGR